MAYINPQYLRDCNVVADGVHWIVWTKNYAGDVRQWRHRTAKAAFRRLASAIAGKLQRKGDCNAAVCDPQGAVWNYRELQQGFRRF